MKSWRETLLTIAWSGLPNQNILVKFNVTKKKTERERQTLYTYQHKTRKVYNNTYNVYLPKINSKNLIKALDVTTSLWENWRMKEYVKSQHEMLTTEFKKWEFNSIEQITQFLPHTKKCHFKEGGGKPTLKRIIRM